MKAFVEIITAILGTLGFSIVFRSKKEQLLALAVGGGLSWAASLVSAAVLTSEAACYFLASSVIGIYGEVMARVLKTPTTNILIPSLLPLIPGGGLYYTMRYAISQDMESFSQRGMQTLVIALAIAMGIIIVRTVSNLIFNKK